MPAIPSSLIEHAGWVLLHSVWQFAAVAALIFVGNRLLKNASASARYMLLLSGLLLVSVAPAVTWFVLPKPVEDTAVADVEPSALPLLGELSPLDTGVPQLDPAFEYPAIAPSEIAELPTIPPAVAIENVSAVKWYERLDDVLQPWLSTIVVLWCLGVLLFSVRPVFGWLNVRRLRKVGTSLVAESVQQALHSIAERLQVSRRVEILASTVVTSPIVVGCFRSVILLPTSFIANVPTSQLEAILAHELAHVRRYDYLVNLLQTLIETLFFYHPAVWWLSYRIRIERENCCDDLVVATFANKADYGRALLAVEEFRNTPVSPSTLALGAEGASLLDRVRRLMQVPEQDQRAGSAGAVVLTLLTIALLTVGLCVSSDTQADEKVPVEVSDGISAKSIPIQSNSYVARLPNGRSVELVGITTKNGDAGEGWKPDGSPLGEMGAAWPETSNVGNTEYASESFGWPSGTARDFLILVDGVKDEPSVGIRFTNNTAFSTQLPSAGPKHRLRITNDTAAGASWSAPNRPSKFSVRVAVTDERWGKWQEFSADSGLAQNPVGNADLYRDVYARVKVLETRNSDESLSDPPPAAGTYWRGSLDRRPPGPEIVIQQPLTHHLEYDIQVRGIDSSGNIHACVLLPQQSVDLNRRTHTVHFIPKRSSALKGNKLSSFQFRLRPFQHLVKFENVETDRVTGEPSEVKVTVESIPIRPPDTFVAKLPGGQSIELVGITNNNEPAIEGWKPNGRRLQEGIDMWPPGIVLGENARDFLFRLDGLKTVPSLRFTLPGSESLYSSRLYKLPRPVRIRAGLRLQNADRPTSGRLANKSGVVQVALTDEPWGEWLQVSATDGSILNPLAETDRFAEGYDAVKIRRVESLHATSDPRDFPAGPGLTLYRSQQHALDHGFRVRGIDSAGEEVWLVPTSDRREVDGKPAYPVEKTWRMHKPLPEGRTLSRFEYRLRPYRHLVTFENVATEQPNDKPTQVKVTVEPIAVPQPENYLAKLPGGLSVELVGITKNGRPAKEGWKPDGKRMMQDVGGWPDIFEQIRLLPPTEDYQLAAIDFLFQFRGRNGVPSVFYPAKNVSEVVPIVPGAETWRTRCPVTTVLGSEDPFYKTAQVLITDEPWGKWLQVSANDGQVLNPPSNIDAYRSDYNSIAIKQVTSTNYKGFAKGPALVLQAPADHLKRYDFRIRAVDSAGDAYPMGRWGPSVDSDKKITTRTFPLHEPLPDGRTLDRFEFCLRPYRHLVTFENVATNGPCDEPSKVKVQVDTLQTDGKPSNAKTVDFPSATDTSHVPLKNEPAVMWIHSKQHVHFVLYHDGFMQTGVSYSELGDASPYDWKWKFDGKINVMPGEHWRKDYLRSFQLNFRFEPPDVLLRLDNTAYDLKDGRVFVLGKSGKPIQLSIPVPSLQNDRNIQAMRRFRRLVNDKLKTQAASNK